MDSNIKYIKAFVTDCITSVLKSHLGQKKKISLESIEVMKQCSQILLNLKALEKDSFDDESDEYSKLTDEELRSIEDQS